MASIPIEIVNKILDYVSDLTPNHMVIMQYHLLTNKEYYKINFGSNLLWNIKSTLVMKRYYPFYKTDFSLRIDRELYKYGKSHYETQLRKKIIK